MEVWREEKRFKLQCFSPYNKYKKLVFNGAKITIMVKQQQAPEYQDS
jgi:hypothetical protein